GAGSTPVCRSLRADYHFPQRPSARFLYLTLKRAPSKKVLYSTFSRGRFNYVGVVFNKIVSANNQSISGEKPSGR
ncbi:MAG: hypothetical protein K2N76_01185, partial [Muribaculaceae bacterium]|nr:hypothetical protein [Muribaculaceae bacterium]